MKKVWCIISMKWDSLCVWCLFKRVYFKVFLKKWTDM